MGYKSNSGDSTKALKKRIEDLNIDTSHFYSTKIKKIVRTRENVFVDNSTCGSKTLRSFYKKETENNYKCSICGLEPFWNGKPLTLILDHIDGKNNNNSLSNLRWVCPNCNIQLDTTNGKNIHRKKLYKCMDCGKTISRSAVRCVECQKKYKLLKKRSLINREDLKKKIREKSFVEIGKEFGISDNAIKKWCDYFNLPRRKIDIKKYTDSEWNNI